MTTFRPRHLSVSAVQSYARCPACWHRRYVERTPEPATPPMAFGKAFAEALEAHHRGGDAEAVFARAHAVTGVAHPGAEHGLRLLDLYRERYSLVGTPERKFELYLPDRVQVPVPILGFLDLETDREVVEFKTSRNPWSEARAASEYQAAVYAWAFQRANQRRPDGVRYLIFSTRSPDVQEILVHPSGSDVRLFELAAIATWRGIVGGKFEPDRACRTCRSKETVPWNFAEEPSP